jgi:hypothetical protein
MVRPPTDRYIVLLEHRRARAAFGSRVGGTEWLSSYESTERLGTTPSSSMAAYVCLRMCS